MMILSVKGSLIQYAAYDFSNSLRITSALWSQVIDIYVSTTIQSILGSHHCYWSLKYICVLRSSDGANIDPTKGKHIHTLFTCRMEEFKIQRLCHFRPHATWTYWLGMGWSYPDFPIITGRLDHPIWESAWTCIVQPVHTQNLIASHFHQVDSRNVSKLS